VAEAAGTAVGVSGTTAGWVAVGNGVITAGSGAGSCDEQPTNSPAAKSSVPARRVSCIRICFNLDMNNPDMNIDILSLLLFLSVKFQQLSPEIQMDR
jgi:hypothetical protein